MFQEKNSDPDVFELILDSMKEGDSSPSVLSSQNSNWNEPVEEGQLSVDVAEDKENVIVVSTMAGADSEKIEVYVHNDLLTIRGTRKRPLELNEKTECFHEECFWGPFSRTVVLPVDVKGDLARADYKNGILIIKIPKKQSNARIPVTVVED